MVEVADQCLRRARRHPMYKSIGGANGRNGTNVPE